MDNQSCLNSYKIRKLYEEVYEMSDDSLVEEVLHIKDHQNENVDKVIANYMKKGFITKRERESLIGYYILCWEDVV